MICKQCGKENGFAKKCCSSCGAFLEGWTINNVTGEYGYRDKDGGFTTIDNMEPPKQQRTIIQVSRIENNRVTLKVQSVTTLREGITTEILDEGDSLTISH